MTSESGCCADDSKKRGPGYESPLAAMKEGPREKLLFVTCPRFNSSKPDMIAVVDVDPESDTFCTIVNRLELTHAGDEAHHTGWNACSSCFGQCGARRSHLIVPCLNSSRIYIIDTTDPVNLKLSKVIEPDQLLNNDVSFPHTTHCLADGNIMISTLGDARGNAKGDFLLIDGKTFEVTGKWIRGDAVPFNYDFWYQPRHNVMLSTEWGHPRLIKAGFMMDDVRNSKYGSELRVWNWRERTLRQTIDLGSAIPLEVRFLHNPDRAEAFLATALGSALFYIHKDDADSEKYVADKVVQIESEKVEQWLLPEMPALITDILISLDDRFLYMSCWLHGDIRQYDISDPSKPKLTGQVFIGGSLHKESKTKLTDDPDLSQERAVEATRVVKGVKVEGGPQMLQLSLDGKRLYVTTSLYSIWDRQFYPQLTKNGAVMLRVDVNKDGGMRLNEQFLVDFGSVPDGPFLAHEMRYPGGDCTSDIWI